jgi:hypothetical protein
MIPKSGNRFSGQIMLNHKEVQRALRDTPGIGDRYPRKLPPVFFVTSATIFAATASIS